MKELESCRIQDWMSSKSNRVMWPSSLSWRLPSDAFTAPPQPHFTPLPFSNLGTLVTSTQTSTSHPIGATYCTRATTIRSGKQENLAATQFRPTLFISTLGTQLWRAPGIGSRKHYRYSLYSLTSQLRFATRYGRPHLLLEL